MYEGEEMGKRYKQLTELNREFISLMLAKGYAKSKIATILKVHRSTIYREIKRNSFVSSWTDNEPYYLAAVAHKRYLKRRKRQTKLDNNKQLRSYVHEKLSVGWSPWQIEGRLQRENKAGMRISHETIYRYIYSDYAVRNRFYSFLRRKHKLRIKRHARQSRFPRELLITNRPQVINERAEFGHWEGDLMMFKRGIKGNLLTLRERKTRYLIAIKNENKTASATALALISTVKSIKSAIKTITFDQGSEFQSYRWIKDCLDASIYFCHPAAPHEKGCIENGNGVLRVELPRKTNIDVIKSHAINQLTHQINNRPLKCLDYQTPAELFHWHLSHENY